MNFRQIKMLNDLEASVARLEEIIANQEVGLDLLKEMHDNNRMRIEKLENPPKRPRGRPRKVNG